MTEGPQEILKKISASFSGFAKKIQPGLEKWFSYKKTRVCAYYHIISLSYIISLIAKQMCMIHSFILQRVVIMQYGVICMTHVMRKHFMNYKL